MKKNAQYVGVDEKYIPEEEKYVDNSTNEEIKDTINEGFKSAKNYVTDKDNQEKFKKAGKKGLKIFKGIGIGYLVFIGIILLIVISIFAVAISNMVKINKNFNENDKTGEQLQQQVIEQINGANSNINKNSFNSKFELYTGTEYGSSVKYLLDEIVTNNKTNNTYIINVTYNGTSTSNTDDIINLKSNFKNTNEYEVILDYDKNGYVNKVTIK